MIEDKLDNNIEELFDDSQPQDVNATYEYVNGNIDPDDSLDEFLEDFQKPKEETGIAEEPSDEDFDDTDEIDSVTSEQAKYTAQFIVDVTDEIAARGLSLCSKNPIDEHRAGKEQKKHLKDLWTKYCKEKGTEIPLGWQITLTMLTIYGSQIPKALEDRKLNEQRMKLWEDQKRLELDREIFEEEKQNYKQKQESLNNNGVGNTAN